MTPTKTTKSTKPRPYPAWMPSWYALASEVYQDKLRDTPRARARSTGGYRYELRRTRVRDKNALAHGEGCSCKLCYSRRAGMPQEDLQRWLSMVPEPARSVEPVFERYLSSRVYLPVVGYQPGGLLQPEISSFDHRVLACMRKDNCQFPFEAETFETDHVEACQHEDVRFHHHCCHGTDSRIRGDAIPTSDLPIPYPPPAPAHTTVFNRHSCDHDCRAQHEPSLNRSTMCHDHINMHQYAHPHSPASIQTDHLHLGDDVSLYTNRREPRKPPVTTSHHHSTRPEKYAYPKPLSYVRTRERSQNRDFW